MLIGLDILMRFIGYCRIIYELATVMERHRSSEHSVLSVELCIFCRVRIIVYFEDGV